MPLTTRTYDLREEADRLHEDLEALAHEIVALQEQANDEKADTPDGEASQATSADLREKYERANDLEEQRDGLLWTIEKHGDGDTDDGTGDGGPAVRADGGTDTAGETDGDDGLVEVDGSMVPKHVADAQDDSAGGHDDAGEQGAGGGGDTGADTDSDTGTDTATESADGTDTAADDPLQVTIKPLTFGESAKSTDLIIDAQQQKQGMGQGGSTQALGEVYEAAAAIQSATFLDIEGKSVEERATVISGQHEGFGRWITRRADELNTPSEQRRENLSELLTQAAEDRATSGDGELR